MTTFDQRGQKVIYQYNAAGDINFESAASKVDVIAELEKLQAELSRAAQAGVLGEDAATDSQYQLKKAIIQAKQPRPEKKSIMDYLLGAKSVIEGAAATAAAAAGLVTALDQAINVVQRIF